MGDVDRTREHLEVLADALTLPSEGAGCSACGGRGWHTAGGNDPAACGACSAGEAWYGDDPGREAAPIHTTETEDRDDVA